MKKILLVANSSRSEAVPAMEKLSVWLEGRAEVVGKITEREQDISGFEADAAITFGGDGTILNVARRLSGRQMPVLGINLGRLGYLAELGPEDMYTGVEALLQDKVEISRRMRLECKIIPRQSTGQACSMFAVNDVLLASSGRICEIDVAVNGLSLTSFRGDGVVVATATGSTAHSLSAGGPILSPALRAMVLTPVCPHELANRPLVVSEKECFCLRAANEEEPPRLFVDGHHIDAPGGIDKIEVKASQNDFLLVQLPETGRFEILRRKMGWGGRVR